MIWLLLALVACLIVFDAVIVARRRPHWRASAEAAHEHLQTAAPDSEPGRMGRDDFVSHYLALCQKATTKARLAIITGLGVAWFIYVALVRVVQDVQPDVRSMTATALIIVALPAPVLVKMVGVRQARKFATAPLRGEGKTKPKKRDRAHAAGTQTHG